MSLLWDQQCSQNFHKISSLRDLPVVMAAQFEKLGFTVHILKSVLVSTQRIIYFGLVVDSVTFKVYLPEEKITQILDLCVFMLSGKPLTIRVVASSIGMLIQCISCHFSMSITLQTTRM